MVHAFLPREMPVGLEALTELALDLRWTWSHASDELWRKLDPDIWNRTHNPWVILQYVSSEQLNNLAQDSSFMEELNHLVAERQDYLTCESLYNSEIAEAGLKQIAYFSLEFGLGEALPMYAGGLGVLAGDYLKGTSDLGLPLVGIGLMYQEGYFRQVVDRTGQQQELYPLNEPSSLPLQPVLGSTGGWLHISLELPGRTILLRAWRANVGRNALYLLDSNIPLNAPADRGITSKLYGDGPETRLLQEIILGIGGWKLIEQLDLDIDVCHLNEGHTAFVILERARQFMKKYFVDFNTALCATKAGNVFTSHTPVAAGFDVYPRDLIEKYFPPFGSYLLDLGISIHELLALGCEHPDKPQIFFNMAYFALRGSSSVNGVSQLHGKVSRQIFQTLFENWPQHEVPVGHITNGIHMPSWDSPWADKLWTHSCGKNRWMGAPENLSAAIADLSDDALWKFCAQERIDLIHYARQRLALHLGQRGAAPEIVNAAYDVLDPNVLIIGFARRFTHYKRPTLLLHDLERLVRLLNHSTYPIQIIVAGKAHPRDEEGKRMVQQWVMFSRRPDVRRHVVFLEDYDLDLAQQLVQGVDLWINTPQRPWEACGTSGMKVLVNGGLNLSELDGWWAEAYQPEYGWALSDGTVPDGPELDSIQAENLYNLIENEIAPEFYARDDKGIPRQWVARMRASMSQLAPKFSCNRMVHQYVNDIYLPAGKAYRERSVNKAQLAAEICTWHQRIVRHWSKLHFGNSTYSLNGETLRFEVQVYLDDILPSDVQVQLYAEPTYKDDAIIVPMQLIVSIAGSVGGYIFQADVPSTRPANQYTARIVPNHSAARVPMEANLILWQR